MVELLDILYICELQKSTMELFYRGKTAWITGASSGIGESLAYQLAGYGTNVIISSNQEAELRSVQTKIKLQGGNCEIIPFDLSDPNCIPGAAEQAFSCFGTIDFLFNNGGISQRSLVVETPITIDRKIMEVNYFSNVALAKAVLPRMIAQGGGSIAVTSSLSGLFGFPLRSAYCASKHALHGFYETLRIEHQHDNIFVTIACPDRVRTRISIHALDRDGKPHGTMDARQDKGISPEKCANDILRAVRKRKIIVLIGGTERFAVYLKRYIPSLFYKLIGKVKAT